MNRLILASSSPRRKELLSQMGLSFRSVVRPVDETVLPGESVSAGAVRLSRIKVEAVRSLPEAAGAWIVGADTLIEFESKVIGKPAGRTEAADFLRLFSGRSQRVVTGISLYNGRDRIVSAFDVSEVRFASLTEGEIEWYLGTDEWKDAAGGYKIQERGSCLIEGITGSYSTVMGLPIRLLYVMLRDNNYPLV